MIRTATCLTLGLCMTTASILTAEEKGAAQPVPTDLPGITSPDRTPQACVNCHANNPQKQADYRLTTLLKSWRNGSDSAIVVKARAAAPAGVKLKGKHPDIAARIKVIPTDCLECHGATSKKAPPFKRLLHAIHLGAGSDNHFLARGNTCTNCHKLDQTTGAWSLGSGTEK